MLESTEPPNVAITAEAAVDPRSLAPWIITGQSVRVALSDDVRARARAKAEPYLGSHDPPFPPASADDIARTEEVLGFSLPESLADFCTTIANGGRGFVGVVNECPDDRGNTAVDVALNLREPDDDPVVGHAWLPRVDVVPIYYWGCQTYSCVDRDGRMIGLDGWEWVPDGRTFEEWLDAWTSGSLHQPVPQLPTSGRIVLC